MSVGTAWQCKRCVRACRVRRPPSARQCDGDVNTCLLCLHRVVVHPGARKLGQPDLPRVNISLDCCRVSQVGKMELFFYTSSTEILLLSSAFHFSCTPRFALCNKMQLRAHSQRAFSNSRRLRQTNSARATAARDAQGQAYPLKGYYDILKTPCRAPRSAPTSTVNNDEQSPADKLSIVFGTRLAGPGYSSTRYNPSTAPQSTWKRINGIAIPPRPEEPDNCCMSGCVHCVWDDYRDDVEEWALRVQEAQNRQPRTKKGESQTHSDGDIKQQRVVTRREVANASMSMDDDGGGSETNWGTGSTEMGVGDELFSNIPVGIREFMRTEKRLKQKRSKAKERA